MSVLRLGYEKTVASILGVASCSVLDLSLGEASCYSALLQRGPREWVDPLLVEP